MSATTAEVKHSTPSKPLSSSPKKIKKKKHLANGKDDKSDDASLRRSERSDRKYGDEFHNAEHYNALYETISQMAPRDRDKGRANAKHNLDVARKTFKALAYIEQHGCGIPVNVATRLFKKAQTKYNDRVNDPNGKFALSKNAAVLINRQVNSALEKVMYAVQGFMTLDKRVKLDAPRVKEAAIITGVVSRDYMLGFGRELNHNQTVEREMFEDQLKHKVYVSVKKHKKEERAAERAAEEETAASE